MEVKNLVKCTVEVLNIIIKLYKCGKISYDDFIENVEIKRKFLEVFSKSAQSRDKEVENVLCLLDGISRDHMDNLLEYSPTMNTLNS